MLSKFFLVLRESTVDVIMALKSGLVNIGIIHLPKINSPMNEFLSCKDIPGN